VILGMAMLVILGMAMLVILGMAMLVILGMAMLVTLVHLAMLLQGTLDVMGGSDRLVSGLPRIAVGQDCVQLRCCAMATRMRR
jgi:hypothetical protein